MELYERSELGGVGEGLCPLDSPQPLTQLRLTTYAKAPAVSLHNPLPKERENRPTPPTPHAPALVKHAAQTYRTR